MDLLDGRTDDRLVLRRVTVRGDRLDPVCARLAVEGALRGADVSIPGLPPDAIVCIRSLADPSPGRFRADRASSRPPREWQSALARRIEEACRAAARPWLGPVPAGAVAVVFASGAELLACLARDVTREESSGAWWYRGVVREGVDASAIVAAMIERAEHVPAAMALLADKGELAPFARRIPASAARRLTETLIHRFGLTGLHRGAASPSDTDEPLRGPEPHGPPTWAPAAPETAELRRTGSLEQELLVGLALTLARAPEAARRGPFALRASHLLSLVRGATSPAVPGDVTLAGSAIAAGQGSAPSRGGEHTSGGELEARLNTSGRALVVSAPRAPAEPSGAAPDSPSPLAISRRDGDDGGAAPGPAAASLRLPPSAPGQEATSSAAHAAAPANASFPPAPPMRSPTSDVARAPDGEAVPPHDAPPARTDLAPERPRDTDLPARSAPGPSVRTRLGGLFFLINVGLALELYGDFTSPLSPGIDLSIWDFVDLVGRDLLGAQGPELEDPVFALLARLADRSPGEPPRAAPGPWRDSLMPLVRTRILAAFPARPDGDPFRTLLALPATVHFDDTHLDVVMSLAELPIDVRLSGLDRDPGWVPAAGRYVAFHFEA